MVKYINGGMIPSKSQPKPDKISEDVRAKQDSKPTPELPYETALRKGVGLFPQPFRRPLANIVVPIVILLGLQAFGRRYL
jgi:hypothetical protein